MNKINYVTGDATTPQGEGKKIICHICNDIGAWGAGFVLALSKKWRYPEDFYRVRQEYPLGDVDVLNVEEDISVANMIAQHGIERDSKGNPPIRYDALKECLIKVNQIAMNIDAPHKRVSLHMPRIGAGLAGGDWSVIEKLIEENVRVPVTVYDLT